MAIANQRLTRNNFDFLRFLFAGTVCLVHAYHLSGYEQLAVILVALSSEVAVKAFFVVSGFLIVMSYERSSTFISYVNKRFRRIYPAYFVVIILCAFGLVAVSSESVADYFSLGWLKYLAGNLAFLNFVEHDLPGVFIDNEMQAVNGALWTLKIEVMFYMCVPVFVYLFRKYGHLLIIVSVYLLSVLYVSIFAKLAEETGSSVFLVLGRQLPGQLSYFMVGAFYYYYLPVFERQVRYFLLCAVAFFILDYYFGLFLLEPFYLSTLVVYFGLFMYLGNFGKYGDFSYGVYILHFPIIQLFIHYGWFGNNPWLFLLFIIITTLLAALII